MTMTMKNAARFATTTAAAMDAYYDEITVSDAEIAMAMAEDEAADMAMAEAMDEALAAILDAKFWEDQVNEALAIARESNDPRDWEVYSDLYKSVYGVRPRL
jgi:DNA transposition AAA+ family ATPase